MEAIISGISFLNQGEATSQSGKKKIYRMSVVSRPYCWSSLVNTSLTNVGVPENAFRTKLKNLHRPSLKSRSQVSKTKSLALTDKNHSAICYLWVYLARYSELIGYVEPPLLARAWSQKVFQFVQRWFHNFFEYFQSKIQLFPVWDVPRHLSQMRCEPTTGRMRTYRDILSRIEFSPVFVMIETEL